MAATAPSSRELLRALAAGQLVLHYQPLVRLATGAHEGMEALVRWRHPRRGLLGPADFLDVAEQSGLAPAIGAFVLREVFGHLRVRDAAGLEPERCFVNLSPGEVSSRAFAPRVLATLADSGIAPSRLGLELSAPGPDERAAAAAAVEELQAGGVAVALHAVIEPADVDALPVDLVKVDGELVRAAASTGGASAKAALRALADHAHARGMEVAACGVETTAQRRTAAAAGCDLAEGWLFAPPRPADGTVGRPVRAVRPRAVARL